MQLSLKHLGSERSSDKGNLESRKKLGNTVIMIILLLIFLRLNE